MIVLNYHALAEGDAPSEDWTLPVALFERHLSLLADRLLSPAAFLARADDDGAARAGEALLTFDDAFLSDHEVVQARFVETGRIPGFMSFVPVAHVGEAGRMDWAMVKALDRSGSRVGSHGVDHVDLTLLDPAALGRELAVSKATLEDRLGREVPDLAFPFGRFSRRVWEAALAAGYRRLFTIQLGHHRGFEPFLVSRLCVTNRMDADFMARHLADPDAHRGLAYRIASRLGLYRTLMRRRFG